jgi:glycosyltransferase involved in cell wall biosynthesis
MRKICHISTAHPPTDDRIFYKECISLEKNGFVVYFIVPSQAEESVRNIKIVPLPIFKNRFKRIILGTYKTYQLAKKIDAAIYHFHDPELIPLGLKLKLSGKKVIYDVHELVYYQLENKKWLGKMVKIIQWIYLQFEKRAVKKLDGIILAEDGYMDYFLSRYSIYKTKFQLIRNYSILSLIDLTVPANLNEDRQKLIYMGGLSQIRGIKEIIQALELMKNPPVFLLFGRWEDPGYQSECINLAGWKFVNYLGFRKLEEIYPYLKVSDLTIAMLYPIKNYLTSLPVKAFEYMAMEKPMILSDFPYWKEIFGKCAVFANPYNPTDIAEKIQTLLNDKSLRKELGENGRRAVVEKYSWESEEQRLLDLYNRVLENGN